jgi:hypothetical protein
MTHPLARPGPELVRKNRRILAERLNWPKDAVEACEQVDDKLPGWLTMWSDGPLVRPGFYSARLSRRWGEGTAYGETPDELKAQMESWPWLNPFYRGSGD